MDVDVVEDNVDEIVREIVANVAGREQKRMKILFLFLLRGLQRCSCRCKELILFFTFGL